MSPAELKKYRARQRKARKAEEKRREEKRQEQKKKQAGQDDPECQPQEELIPYKLERPAEPLTEALYFLRPLQALLPQRLHTHLLAFNIHLRRKKPMLMLQALKRSYAVCADDAELHTCAVLFMKHVRDELPRKWQQAEDAPLLQHNSNQPTGNINKKTSKNKPNKSKENKSNQRKSQQQNNLNNQQLDPVCSGKSSDTAPVMKASELEQVLFDEQENSLLEVINKEMLTMFGTMDPNMFNEEFLNKYQHSVPHRLQAARSMLFLDVVQKERAITIATDLADHLQGRDLKSLEHVLEWLTGIECEASPEEVLRYKTHCSKIFPRAQVFMTTNTTTTLTTTTACGTAPLSCNSVSICDVKADEECDDGEVISNHVNHVLA